MNKTSKYQGFFAMIMGLGVLMAGAGQETVFQSFTLPKALVEGKTLEKAVVVKFHADWCHFCKKMDRETFRDVSLLNILEDYIPIKIDIDTKEGLAMAHQYGVTVLPTIIIFGVDGEKKYHQQGFHSSKQMKKALTILHE